MAYPPRMTRALSQIRTRLAETVSDTAEQADRWETVLELVETHLANAPRAELDEAFEYFDGAETFDQLVHGYAEEV